MEILKNDKEAFLVFAMQGEANISNIKFKIKLSDLNIDDSFETQNLLTIIQFEDDYLTNIPDTNINLEIKDDDLIINWLIGKAMTLEAKEREFQVIIKNKKTGEIFKSYKSIFKVQKSIDNENEDADCNTTCIAGMLEQWNLKMQQIVDTGGNVDLSEYAKLSEIAEKYYNKTEIDEKIDPLITKQEVTTTLEPYSLKSEVDTKLNISTYNSDKSTFQLKQDNNLSTTDKTIVGAINEIKRSIPEGADLSNYYQKSEIDSKLSEKVNTSTYNADKQTFQLKNDTTFNTTEKTVSGAINELKNSYDNINNELANKANISSLNNKQDKNDESLETEDKTIVGAINEVNTLAKNASAPDLSDYYQKSETYTQTEVNNKLDTKLDKSTYNSDKPTFQLKEDNNLNTTNKTIVGAINEINTELEGGESSNFFGTNNTSPSIEGEALTINYFTKSNTYWTGNNFPYTHNGNTGATDVGYLILKVDKTNLDNSCNVLKIKCRINGLSIVGTTSRYASVSIFVRTGGNFTAPTTFTDYLSQEPTARFSVERSTSPDLSDNNKEFYVFIPEIDKNDIFIDIYASEDSNTILENIEVIQMLNTNINLLLYNNKYSIPFKIGINSSIYIGDGGIVERSNGGLNISYGIKALKLANSIESKYVSRTLGVGHYASENLRDASNNTFLGIENCRYLEKGSYNVIVGDNACSYTHVSASSSNYDYITDMNQCTIIGSYAKPKINSSTNENIIGYNAKGNGSNTFTLGNSNITALYAQVSSITQFSDPRIKEDIKDIDINEVISNIKGLKVIHASYMDLEEFIGNSENDKHKLMFDGTSYRNSFKNDTRLVDRVFHPIDPVTKKRKVASIQVLDENGESITKEVDETLTIDDCIEITLSQLLPALVVTNQYLLNEIESLKNTIKQQNDLINRILSRLEALETNK